MWYLYDNVSPVACFIVHEVYITIPRMGFSALLLSDIVPVCKRGSTCYRHCKYNPCWSVIVSMSLYHKKL